MISFTDVFKRVHRRLPWVRIDAHVETIENVYQTRKNGIVIGLGLRGFPKRGRGYELRGRRENNVNVTLRKPERLESISLVDEVIDDSLR